MLPSATTVCNLVSNLYMGLNTKVVLRYSPPSRHEGRSKSELTFSINPGLSSVAKSCVDS